MPAGGSQVYIGTPNGVVLAIDQRKGAELKARYYTSYEREAHEVTNWDQLFFELEKFYDDLRFPYPTNNMRSFGEEQKRGYPQPTKEKVVKDEELLMNHGDLGSFIIRVQHRQNSSWQGRITWIEKNQTMYFRSAWEMMKLIESALDTVAPPEDAAEEPGWDQE
jgi:hypothetical protein